jgi:hypothetical protein
LKNIIQAITNIILTIALPTPTLQNNDTSLFIALNAPTTRARYWQCWHRYAEKEQCEAMSTRRVNDVHIAEPS